MTDQIILRPATIADVQTLARLWVATFPDKFGPILGPNAEPVLRDWLRLSDRHLQTTTIAQIHDMAGGYITLETPTAPRPDSGRWLWHALQLHNGIFGALRSFLLMVLVDSRHKTDQDEIYIEMLGVRPKWRGRGLARTLINYAETVARQEEVTQLSLTVVKDNAAALSLYQKMGFEPYKEQHSRILQWITGHAGYYEMVKPVD